MADAAVSKTVVERRASSTLASGTIPNKKSADRKPGQPIFFSMREYRLTKKRRLETQTPSLNLFPQPKANGRHATAATPQRHPSS